MYKEYQKPEIEYISLVAKESIASDSDLQAVDDIYNPSQGVVSSPF